MLAAASTAARNGTPSWRRIGKRIDPSDARASTKQKPAALMLQLVTQNARYAKTNHSGSRAGCRYWNFLLVPDEALSSGRRRFPLGAASRATLARPRKSLRYAVRAIPADGWDFRSASRSVAAGDRRRNLLRCQFRRAGLWSNAAQLSRPADLPSLSLLGGNALGAVVSHHR